ncbi:MAG TPA: hypothetical protein VM695_08205 [Phycisphaerae bacterium]|nr:hypothetical protein [Phycisphaerae bacterium]
MRRALIVALVCINVGLLAALIGVNLNRADAQTFRGGNDYIMVTGKIESSFDAIYVIDLKSRALAAWRFDRTAKKLVPYKGRILEQDFAR